MKKIVKARPKCKVGRSIKEPRFLTIEPQLVTILP